MAPSGLGINFSQDGTDLADHTAQADYLIGLGINRFRINIPVYTTENENPSFRDALTAIGTMLKSKGAYVVMGYNAFPLNNTNFAAFKTQLRAAAIRLAALGIDEICVGNEEDLNLGFGSQAILRAKLQEVCEAIAVTDGTDIVVSTAITTNVYAAWAAEKAVWKDYMTLDLHIYGGLAAAHFNTYANGVAADLVGANYYCGEYGVDGAEGSGRLAFSNETDWIREVKRRTDLLEANGWPSYYYFAYKLGASDGNNTKWSANRSGTTGETRLLATLTETRHIRAEYNSTYADVDDVRKVVEPFGTALNFTGSAGSVSLGTGNPFTGSFYVSCWMKWAGTNGGFQTIFAKRDSYAADGQMFSMSLNNDTGALNVDTVTSFIPFGYIPPVNQWVHIVWTHNTTTGHDKLYVNGILNSTQGIGTLGTKTTSLLSIGACQSPSADWFNGKIDKPIIGTGEPTAANIIDFYLNRSIPGTIWTQLEFDEGSGTTATDASGNGRNGTIADATYVTDPVMTNRSLASGRSVASGRASV